ncbi:uncharacterized protein VTP21DRAFT_7998 [Calcarisporiella thermophila]|uniref:uncharacterized protein n=1 Tax=Calcarisporiella thermophila TaxID=911321 RepID=UPI003743091D
MSGKKDPHPKKTSSLTIEPISRWHDASLPPLSGSSMKPLSDAAIAERLEKATALLAEENAAYERSAEISSSDRAFLSTVMQSGTLNDRISALTLVVQESPLHAMKTLETLMGMARKKSRKEAVMAITSLKDLLVGSVLPDRKLKYFRDQPLTDPKVAPTHLIMWAFEDFLKKQYFELLQIIELLSHDPLVHVRRSIVSVIYELLAAKPEQEQNLLRLLVNKLGDQENKIASKTSYLLHELLVAHPGMKLIVAREIEELACRPNVSEKAQYYGVITLNQTILSAREVDVANKLVEIYFVLFRRILHQSEMSEKSARNGNEASKKQSHGKPKRKSDGKLKKPEEEEEAVNSKMVAAILTGVNRAFPFAKVEDSVFEGHMDTLFRITHKGTFNVSVQALVLIFQVSSIKQSVSDRFYRTLYESLLDRRLITSSKQAMYLNLLFKALKVDTAMARVKAFVKRIVQVIAYHQPPFICGAFFLLSQLMAAHPGVRALIEQPEEDDEEEHFVDAPDEDEDIPVSDKPKPTKKAEAEEKKNEDKDKYDGRKRDPLYSNANRTCLWELIPFTSHFHPTVSLYAKQLIENVPIQSKPDLHIHTLAHFLDRFVYRNPKKPNTKGASIMQPSAGAHHPGRVTLSRGAPGAAEVPVNSEEFWRQRVEDVPVDQVFFHTYFTQKMSATDSKSRRKKADKGEGEGDEEDEIWRAMLNSMPGGFGEEEDEDDEDMDEDLMEMMSEEEGEEEMEGEERDEQDDGEEEVEELEGEDEGLDEGEVSEDLDGFDFGEEEDDLIPSDEEEEEEEADEEETTSKGRSKKRRKTAKDLPVFASFDDYAHLLQDQD